MIYCKGKGGEGIERETDRHDHDTAKAHKLQQGRCRRFPDGVRCRVYATAQNPAGLPGGIIREAYKVYTPADRSRARTGSQLRRESQC